MKIDYEMKDKIEKLINRSVDMSELYSEFLDLCEKAEIIKTDYIQLLESKFDSEELESLKALLD